jgi:hypothetical protein
MNCKRNIQQKNRTTYKPNIDPLFSSDTLPSDLQIAFHISANPHFEILYRVTTANCKFLNGKGRDMVFLPA